MWDLMFAVVVVACGFACVWYWKWWVLRKAHDSLKTEYLRVKENCNKLRFQLVMLEGKLNKSNKQHDEKALAQVLKERDAAMETIETVSYQVADIAILLRRVEKDLGLIQERNPPPDDEGDTVPGGLEFGSATITVDGKNHSVEMPESTMDKNPLSYLTDRARKVMQLAEHAAFDMGAGCIPAPCVLIGMLKEGSGVAAHVLQRHLCLRDVEKEIKHLISLLPVDLREFTTFQSKAIIKAAATQAKALGHNYIGTEHLLLGLLEGTSIALLVLRNIPTDPFAIRMEIMELIKPENQKASPG